MDPSWLGRDSFNRSPIPEGMESEFQHFLEEFFQERYRNDEREDKTERMEQIFRSWLENDFEIIQAKIRHRFLRERELAAARPASAT